MAKWNGQQRRYSSFGIPVEFLSEIQSPARALRWDNALAIGLSAHDPQQANSARGGCGVCSALFCLLVKCSIACHCIFWPHQSRPMGAPASCLFLLRSVPLLPLMVCQPLFCLTTDLPQAESRRNAERQEGQRRWRFRTHPLTLVR
jgi:hypothetical protein